MPATIPVPAAGEEASPVVVSSRAERLRAALDRNVFVVTILGTCCVLHAVVIRGVVISDGWYTLIGGRIVSGGLPNTDTLTAMTLGRTWVDQQWLGHLAFYALWVVGGWPLGATAVIVLYVGAFGIAAMAARRLGASDRSTALMLLLGFLSGITNTVFRTQIAAYPLFALVLALLLRDARTRSRRVYLVFPVLVLWANIHGSVVLGAALVTLLGLTEAAGALRRRTHVRDWLGRAAALVVLPWLCVLASPYATGLPRYYRSILDNPTLEHSVSEWEAATLRGQPIFFVFLIGGIWLAARARATLTPFAVLALLGCGVAGLSAVRNDVWYALTAAAVLPAALDAAWRPDSAPRRAAINVVLAAVAVAAGAIALVWVAAHPRRWFERDYPPRAASVVAAAAARSPSLRVFANERYADWLLFTHSALQGRVAYDVRFELLRAAQLRKIVAFRLESGVDWQRIADGYGLLVLDPVDDAGAVKLFERDPATRILYRDKNVVVLQRPQP